MSMVSANANDPTTQQQRINKSKDLDMSDEVNSHLDSDEFSTHDTHAPSELDMACVVVPSNNNSNNKNHAAQTANNLNLTSNSSGIGGSISSPNSAFDPSSNNSIYTNCSVPVTPSTPPSSNYDSSSSNGGDSSKININAPIFNMNSTSSKAIELMSKLNLNGQNNMPKNLSSDNLSESNSSELNQPSKYLQNFNNFISLPIGLGANMVDYDPFNDYMGMDKNMLDSLLQNQKKPGLSMDAQQQQQLLAQAIAAAVANNTPNSVGNENQATKSTQRSLLENIEQLNSKFKHHQDLKQNVNLNSLLAAAASNQNPGSSNNSSINDSIMNYNSPSSNYKRQSAGAFLNSNMLFSTPIPNSTSPSNSNTNLSNTTINNNRLNSTPNIGFNTNVNLNDQNRYFTRSTANGVNNNNQVGSNSPEKMNSMSASNSSFNLSGSNNLDLTCGNNPNASVNSGYDDDDVFANPPMGMVQNGSGNNNNNGNLNPLFLANANNLDPYMLQLYRSLLNSNNELLLNNSNNLSNFSMNSSQDILNTNNSNNFLNLTGSSNSTYGNQQLKGLNSFNQTNTSPNVSLNNSLSPAALAAAVLKQRQITSLNNSNRLVGNQVNNGSNIAALTSNNMASFLANGAQQQQNLLPGGANDQNAMKRRINSIATAYNLSASSAGNSSPLQMGNNSPLFPSTSTHNVGPNASHLLQNSSLASSARLNTSTSTNATASVLGNNSSLSHALNSLHNQQHQQNNYNNLNSSPTPSSNHNLLSALSLSTSSGASLSNTLLSSSGKPLRSERLPPQMVDEIIKQAKNRRRQGGKKEVCVFCRNNGEKEPIYTSHTLKDAQNNVACPILRLYQCPICHASGDQAHTIKYCPYAEKDSACIKLFKETGRMSQAAALLMNSFPGSATPPSGSPPETPSPLNQNSFLNQSVSPSISSPNSATATLSLAQAINNLNNYNNFNLSNSPSMAPKSVADLNLSLNKSFGGVGTNSNSNSNNK